MSQPSKESTLAYWLEWIDGYKAWWRAQPKHIYMPSRQDVLDMPYHILDQLAAHFNTRVYPEDSEHRKWVSIEVWNGMACVTVQFRSKRRAFTYKPISDV